MLPLIPVAISLLAGAAWWSSSARKGKAGKAAMHGEMTPERQIIYQTALNTVKDPDKLLELSKQFANEGLPVQSELLAKRARIRLLPDVLKEARKDAYRKGMTCKDAEMVRKLAAAFDKEGATGAAASLREYANALPPKTEVAAA